MREIHDETGFQQWLREQEGEAVAVQGLDLRAHTEPLLERSRAGSLFLACALDDRAVHGLMAHGAFVFPSLDGFEFEVHRPCLYDVETLFAGFEEGGRSYAATLDARIYRQYLDQGAAFPDSIRTTLARRLHDHSMTDALHDLIEGERVVAFMGGHGMERASDMYRRIARLSRRLTRAGLLVTTGGGPGAMEAAHVGAYFAGRDDEDLEAALHRLAPRPSGSAPGKEYADPDWLERAWSVREQFPLDASQVEAACSVGIPTWFYGHEPPAPFATHIAKYFANSVREDGLLTIARGGVVFAPGSAGTTQEIFQDAAQNHYRTAGYESPMILWDVDYWTHTRPVWPLLEAVSRDRTYGELVDCTDDDERVFDLLTSFEPPTT